MMKYLLIVPMLLIFGCESSDEIDVMEKSIQSKAFTIGDVIEINSKILNEDRTLNIFLPISYNPDSTNSYPVIYLLDGSIDEDIIHMAGVVQFNSFSWINRMPECIVVGIANIDRQRDFTFPTRNEKDKDDFPTTGKSSLFISFIKNELMPFIDQTYRTSGVNTISGQSFGGLLATEILFTQPEMFDNYLIVSPSLWWDDESILNCKIESKLQDQRVFIAVGKEGEIMERVAKQLYEMLHSNLADNNISFMYMDDKSHGDALHMAAYTGFDFLFQK